MVKILVQLQGCELITRGVWDAGEGKWEWGVSFFPGRTAFLAIEVGNERLVYGWLSVGGMAWVERCCYGSLTFN